MGLLLTFLFWLPLWQGGGFIGGDLYTYFFPQKLFLAERLQAGEFPLWNPLVGHGYPLIGESQTAALYPLNLVLYRWLDVNTAYVASHLLHYVAAFVACWLLAKRFGLEGGGAILTALVYVYGWFPARSCLEWAIIGGAYLPAALWCVESLWQTGRIRYAVGLSVLMALNLLAGHYNLAFITTLLIVAYLPVRIVIARRSSLEQPTDAPRPPLRTAAAVMGFLILGYLLAAPQLVPSWDLLRSSQRTKTNEEFDPGYGHIPPWYLSQVATPWMWYARDVDPDASLNAIKYGTIPSLTNKVEAHLYFGLIPLALALWNIAGGWWTGRPMDARLRWLAILGVLAAIYATGWLLPVTKHLPGFGYFRGPGRYGIVTTLAVALLAGQVLSRWMQTHRRGIGLLATLILCVTIFDLYWVSRHQWYTFMVSRPPIAARDESVVRRLLRESSPLPRLLSPGPNLATLTGTSATPPYLGFGPDAYYLDGGRLPDPRFLRYLSSDDPVSDVDLPPQFEFLRDAGVTHLLSMKPLPRDWPVRRIWEGFDPLLNPAWARFQEPLFLYELLEAPGRLRFVPESADDVAAVPVPKLVESSANCIAVELESDVPGRLVLADLPWHEWEVRVNSSPAVARSKSSSGGAAYRLHREIDLPAGSHRIEWIYRPTSLWIGLAIAAVTVAALVYLTLHLSRRGILR